LCRDARTHLIRLEQSLNEYPGEEILESQLESARQRLDELEEELAR
jgi:hypothetical protein